MIIKSLNLSNYRRFESCELELPENLIGIIGRNGSGKSTLIEAIGWALYGNKFGRSDKKDVRSHHVDVKSVCSVEMVFVYGGQEYRIVRRLKGKNAGSEAAIYRGDLQEAVAVQDRGVNAFVENLLQLDYRSFTTSVFAQQKELAKLSGLQPEQRRQAINRLINIDRIDKAREHVRRDRNEKQAFLKGKESGLKDKDELHNQKKAYESDRQVKNAEKIKMYEKEQQADNSLQTAKTDYEKTSQLRDKFVELKSQIEKNESRIEQNRSILTRSQNELTKIQQAEKDWQTIQPQLKELPAVIAQKEILDETLKKYNALQMHLKEKDLLQKTIEKERNELHKQQEKVKDVDALESELNTVEERIMHTEKVIDDLQQKYTKAANQKAVSQAQGVELKQKTEKIKELGPEGECPVCTQNLGTHYEKVLAEQNEQLEVLRQAFSDFQNKEKQYEIERREHDIELRKLRAQRDSVAKKLNSATEAQEQLKHIQEHVENYTKQIGFVEAKIKEIGAVQYNEREHEQIKQQHNDLTALDKKAAALKTEADRKAAALEYIENTEKNITALLQGVASLKIEQQALSYDEQIYLEQKAAVENADKAVKQIREKRAAIERECALLENNIQNIVREIKELEIARREIADTKEIIDYLNALDEHFSRFRLELAGRIRPLIAARASELLSLTTHSRYNTLLLDEDYDIQIIDGNTPFPIERFSGGEQDLANLCLRIAISQVVAERSGGAPVNLIVLDEIFGSQDDQRRDRIIESLQQLSTQFRQIFIITHINEIKDMLPVMLHVQAKDEQTSVAELV